MNSKNLSSGLEDYIEAIYIAELNKTQLKGAGLARNLNISRASVSEALSKLVERKLIEYKSYGIITLTPLGKEEAIKVYSKHNILKDFFEIVLLVSPDEAEENGCKIEHIVSQTILDRMMRLTSYCKKHPECIKFNIND
jgi:DtxR family Mn-dependent transcriptional regulator